MERRDAARILLEVARMLELSGANPFKVRAYENAAEALLAFSGDLDEAVRTGSLRELPGIGDTIFSNVRDLATTGRLPLFDALRAKYPPGLADCLRVPGLGARRLRQLHEALGIDSLEALEAACREGRLASLRGFGRKSAEHYLSGIRAVRAASGRFLFGPARARAESLAASLARTDLTLEVAVAGSLRRLSELVRGIDLVASSTEPKDLAAAFVSLPEVVEVISADPPAPSVRFLDGMPATLMIASPEELPAALLGRTGSRRHVEALRTLARERGWTLDEQGLRDGGRRIRSASEADVYAALGLAFVEPELREGTGELEAAAAGRLPHLVQREDLRGVFHVHTDASDGRDDLETMVRAAQARGYACVAITDHSQSAGYAGGLTMDRMRAQRDMIRTLRRRLPEMRILHGTEADILADGSIDYGDEFLAELDLVVASVHSRFGLGREEQTARLIRAVRNPRVAILGHPTGRLLLSREGVAADMEAVIAAAAESGCALEVNASPYRMDLGWRLVRSAIERGATLAIDPDAHSTRELDYVPNGVAMARKGWAAPGAILNARDPDEIVAWLERRRGGPIPESVDRSLAAGSG
jgi:DNA polymerase (family 10)